MTKVIRVEALVSLYITVPNDASKTDVYSFLANNVDYVEALKGISDSDQTMRITDVQVPSEEIDLHWGDGNAVWQAYDGTCPDCGEEIDTGVVEGDECHNCGHSFHSLTEND